VYRLLEDYFSAKIILMTIIVIFIPLVVKIPRVKSKS